MSSENDIDISSTISFILDQITEDSLTGCKEASLEISKNLGDNENALPSLKLSLELYRKLYATDTGKSCHLPVDLIFQNVNRILGCRWSKKFQQDLLHVVSSLCSIAMMQNSEKDLEVVAEFYCSILKSLNVDSDEGSLLKLKILCVLLETFAENSEKVLEKVKNVKSDVEECELFAGMVVRGCDDVAIQTLLFVTPQYVNFVKTDKIVRIIWNEVKSWMRSGPKLGRTLVVVCYLFDLCLGEDRLKYDPSMFFDDSNFWDLIQLGLTEKDQVLRRQAMYLFKKSLGLCKNGEINVTGSSGSKCSKFSWNSALGNELYEIYSEIIIILEFLDEQQIHIIKPIFQMVDKIFSKISKNLIHLSWVVLLHKKALMHESTQVVKWGLSSLLSLPDEFLMEESTLQIIVGLMVPTLSDMSLYYSDGAAISEELTNFFKKVSRLPTGKLFFISFLDKLCGLTWSPEALFFVANALANTDRQPFWSEMEISLVKNFVAKAFKTHNKTIRAGLQCLFLQSVMKLSDGENVSLESILLLLSNFSGSDALKIGCRTHDDVIVWLKNTFSKAQAERILEKYQRRELSNEFNDRSVSMMFSLFYSAFGDRTENHSTKCFVSNSLIKILLSFKDLDKRLYHDEMLHDHYLSVVCRILENPTVDVEQRSLSRLIIPFMTDLIGYVRSKVKHVSGLQNFHACQLHIECFETVLKTIRALNLDCELKSFYLNLLSFLETRESLSAMQTYFATMLLRTIVENFYQNEKPPATCVLIPLNETLKKGEAHSDNTPDFQVLWGKMNSEYLKAKWDIFDCLGYEKLFKNDELGKISSEALGVGGYGVLHPVMSVLRKFLPEWDNEERAAGLIDAVWKQITERRKSEDFKYLVKQFVEMLFQNNIYHRKNMRDKLFQYSDVIFMDSSLAVVNIFVKHIQKMSLTEAAAPLFSQIIGKALIFGPVQRKDERLTFQVCSFVEKLNLCPTSEYPTANEIRARAVEMVLKLDPDASTHRRFAALLTETLIKMEKESSSNKVRYFGDSHVHRVKHRSMQALLLLEPLLYPNQVVAKEVSSYLYVGLMKENPQPSVKYFQEWLLTRILIKYEELLSDFWEYFRDSVEKKTKGLCSLIAITYHLCLAVPSDLTSSWMDKAVLTFLPFCMDQHFEVRLYAQVVLEKLYQVALDRNLSEIISKYRMINQCIQQSIQRGCKGNAAKNCTKLREDFYLTVFNPLEHYSLQSIYWDLPRLANVGADEWISTEMFESCGVTSNLLKNPNTSLENIDEARWLVEKSHHGMLDAGELFENYQKKMVPSKPLLPKWEEAQNCQNECIRKDGLIVVASLIDRIPNLGGLARTCEIFGASEYILNSLKYAEDKQFTSLSVTAEKWIQVKEVKIQDLAEYILGMKQSGYSIIGAEQALYSQPLSEVKFPKKSILLLGNEKEGIPPNLLPLLDICVEIPQVGIIRSLNVHVTGALFIWEYAKQNYFNSSK